MSEDENPKSLYLVQLSLEETQEKFYKIGITSQGVKSRFAYGKTHVTDPASGLTFSEGLIRMLNGQNYIPDNPYIVEIIKTVNYTYGYDANIAEKEFLELVSPYKYSPHKRFSGNTECFLAPDIIAELKEKMNADAKTRNEAAPNKLWYGLLKMQAKERDPFKKHLEILKKYAEKAAL